MLETAAGQRDRAGRKRDRLKRSTVLALQNPAVLHRLTLIFMTVGGITGDAFARRYSCPNPVEYLT